MLSRCELQYLQGEKKLTGSYERKIRCIIRKKIGTWQKSLPLLAQIVPVHQLVNTEPNPTLSQLSLDIPCNWNATKFSNEMHSQDAATKFSSDSNPVLPRQY